MEPFRYAVSFAEVTPMTAPLPLCGDVCENLHRAAALGYAGLELHTRENAPLDIAKIKTASAECGGAITAIATGRLYTQGKMSMLDDDPSTAKAAGQGMRAYIDLAHSLGARDLVVGWAKGNIPPEGERGHYMQRLANGLRSLGEYAAPKGVRLHLEVINRYEANLLTTAEETCSFLEEHELENCFVHLDTFHMNIEESDPYAAIRRCGRRLGYFHVADNTRRYPGSGQLDFIRTLATLKEFGYDGYVTVECTPGPDRLETAKKAIEHLRHCESRLL